VYSANRLNYRFLQISKGSGQFRLITTTNNRNITLGACWMKVVFTQKFDATGEDMPLVAGFSIQDMSTSDWVITLTATSGSGACGWS
jgi:hypothetical protein